MNWETIRPFFLTTLSVYIMATLPIWNSGSWGWVAMLIVSPVIFAIFKALDQEEE